MSRKASSPSKYKREHWAARRPGRAGDARAVTAGQRHPLAAAPGARRAGTARPGERGVTRGAPPAAERCRPRRGGGGAESQGCVGAEQLTCLSVVPRHNNFPLPSLFSIALVSPAVTRRYVSGLKKCWLGQRPNVWHQNLKCKKVYVMLACYFCCHYFKLTNPRLLTEYSCHSTLVQVLLSREVLTMPLSGQGCTQCNPNSECWLEFLRQLVSLEMAASLVLAKTWDTKHGKLQSNFLFLVIC